MRSGAAWERFLENVAFQGGDTAVCLEPSRGPTAAVRRPVTAERSGYIEAIDAYTIGHVSVLLGAGRARKEDDVLPEVGLELLHEVGDRVEAGEPLCVLHGADEQTVVAAREAVAAAYRVGEEAVDRQPVVIEEISEP